MYSFPYNAYVYLLVACITLVAFNFLCMFYTVFYLWCFLISIFNNYFALRYHSCLNMVDSLAVFLVNVSSDQLYFSYSNYSMFNSSDFLNLVHLFKTF